MEDWRQHNNNCRKREPPNWITICPQCCPRITCRRNLMFNSSRYILNCIKWANISTSCFICRMRTLLLWRQLATTTTTTTAFVVVDDGDDVVVQMTVIVTTLPFWMFRTGKCLFLSFVRSFVHSFLPSFVSSFRSCSLLCKLGGHILAQLYSNGCLFPILILIIISWHTPQL